MSIQSVAVPTALTAANAVTAAATSPSLARSAVTDEATSSPVTASRGAVDSPVKATEQKQQVEAAVKAVKEFIQPMAGNLEFQMDEETDQLVIKIVDSSSGELIRQIPSEEMLEIAKALDRLQGLLVRQKA